MVYIPGTDSGKNAEALWRVREGVHILYKGNIDLNLFQDMKRLYVYNPVTRKYETPFYSKELAYQYHPQNNPLPHQALLEEKFNLELFSDPDHPVIIFNPGSNEPMQLTLQTRSDGKTILRTTKAAGLSDPARNLTAEQQQAEIAQHEIDEAAFSYDHALEKYEMFYGAHLPAKRKIENSSFQTIEEYGLYDIGGDYENAWNPSPEEMEPLKEEQFTLLSLAASFAEDPEAAYAQAAMLTSSMVTGRSTPDEHLLKENGRRNAADAAAAVRKKDYSKAGKLLADGLNTYALTFLDIGIYNYTNEGLSSQAVDELYPAAGFIRMFQNNPALKEAAIQQGLKHETIERLQIADNLFTHEQKRLRAEQNMLNAAAMDPAETRRQLQDLLAEQMLLHAYTAHEGEISTAINAKLNQNQELKKLIKEDTEAYNQRYSAEKSAILRNRKLDVIEQNFADPKKYDAMKYNLMQSPSFRNTAEEILKECTTPEQIRSYLADHKMGKALRNFKPAGISRVLNHEYQALFRNDPATSFRFGIVPGGHVVHMLGERAEETDQMIDVRFDQKVQSSYRDVTAQETFQSAGDEKTQKFFRDLAVASSRSYIQFQDDPKIANIHHLMKWYICGAGRGEQQDLLHMLKIEMTSEINALKHDLELFEDARTNHSFEDRKYHALEDGRRLVEIKELMKKDPTDKHHNHRTKEYYAARHKQEEKLALLQTYQNALSKKLNGSLVLPENHLKSREDVTEPASTWTGKLLGRWSSTDEALFPHYPCPNDIKQGVGVQSCFMLSVLTEIAQRDPQAIKDCMRDNGDGTVTVRFQHHNAETEKFEPVYIDVKKTRMHTAVGSSNLYASSSLWVQMMEKAYAKYYETYKTYDAHGRHGMQAINQSNPATFLEAITGRPHTILSGFSPTDNYTAEYYPSRRTPVQKSRNTLPSYYLPEEMSIYNLLKKHLAPKAGGKQEYFTAGITYPDMHTEKQCNQAGLRMKHGYAIMKVFKAQNAKGQERCYVQLRDPYAVFEAGHDAQGKLVDRSAMWKGTASAGLDNMGTFNLELTEFLDYFDTLSASETFSKELHNEQKNWKKHAEEIEAEDPKKEADGMQNTAGISEWEDVDAHDIPEPAVPSGRRMREKDESYEQINTDSQPEAVSAAAADNDQEARQIAQEKHEDTVADVFSDQVKFVEFRKNIHAMITDLKSTDSFWVKAKDTRAFDEMKNALYTLGNYIDRNKPSLDRDEFVEMVDTLKEKTNNYLQNKNAAVAQTLRNNETPGKRAVMRMMTAVVLNTICDLQRPPLPYPQLQCSKLDVLASDIVAALKNPDTRLAIRKNETQRAHMTTTIHALNQYLQKHPDLTLENVSSKDLGRLRNFDWNKEWDRIPVKSSAADQLRSNDIQIRSSSVPSTNQRI